MYNNKYIVIKFNRKHYTKNGHEGVHLLYTVMCVCVCMRFYCGWTCKFI